MFVFLHWCKFNRKDGRQNYGDLLSTFIVKKLSNKLVFHVKHPKMRRYSFLKVYTCIGSKIRTVSENTIVYGSGIISENEKFLKAKFISVRGPRTIKRIIELGYNTTNIIGDPALLMPKFHKQKVDKKYDVGIIPHYVDYEFTLNLFSQNPKIKVIDMLTNDVIKTTNEILECRITYSSSLHGIIISHAYNIPCIWIKISNKLSGDNIKFYDYFESVGLKYFKEYFIDNLNIEEHSLKDFMTENIAIALPKSEIVQKISEELLIHNPF